MLPDTPTVAEAGVPGCEAGLWTALVVPAGVPADIVQQAQRRRCSRSSNDREVQKALKIQGVDPEPGPPEAVAARIRRHREMAGRRTACAKIAGAN